MKPSAPCAPSGLWSPGQTRRRGATGSLLRVQPHLVTPDRSSLWLSARQMIAMAASGRRPTAADQHKNAADEGVRQGVTLDPEPAKVLIALVAVVAYTLIGAAAILRSLPIRESSTWAFKPRCTAPRKFAEISLWRSPQRSRIPDPGDHTDEVPKSIG